MKKSLIFIMFLFVAAIPLFFVGCNWNESGGTSTSSKIQLDLSNARWNYDGNFETDNHSEDEFIVEVVGVPDEITVTYNGDINKRNSNDYYIELHPNSGLGEFYTATVSLSYDEEKYELINDNLPRTLNWKIYNILYLEKEEDVISRPSSMWYGRYSRNLVNYIHFVDEIPDEIKDNPIYDPYYLWSKNENGDLHLYFGLDTSKYKNFKMPEDSSYLFSYFYNLKGITGLDLVDFSRAEDLSNLFRSLGITADADEIEINLPDNLNLQNAENMQDMFLNVGNSNTLKINLGNNFDTSNVTNMFGMFAGCGKNAQSFHLDLGDKFYTSNVTDMEQMFANCGNSSEDFYLDLGRNFDITNTASLKEFLFGCGTASLNTNGWHLEFLGEISTGCDLEWVFASFLKNIILIVHNTETFDALNSMGYNYPIIVLV